MKGQESDGKASNAADRESFVRKRSIKTAGGRLEMVDIAAASAAGAAAVGSTAAHGADSASDTIGTRGSGAGGGIERLPYSIRILLESALRNYDGRLVNEGT